MFHRQVRLHREHVRSQKPCSCTSGLFQKLKPRNKSKPRPSEGVMPPDGKKISCSYIYINMFRTLSTVTWYGKSLATRLIVWQLVMWKTLPCGGVQNVFKRIIRYHSNCHYFTLVFRMKQQFTLFTTLRIHFQECNSPGVIRNNWLIGWCHWVFKYRPKISRLAVEEFKMLSGCEGSQMETPGNFDQYILFRELCWNYLYLYISFVYCMKMSSIDTILCTFRMILVVMPCIMACKHNLQAHLPFVPHIWVTELGQHWFR